MSKSKAKKSEDFSDGRYLFRGVSGVWRVLAENWGVGPAGRLLKKANELDQLERLPDEVLEELLKRAKKQLIESSGTGEPQAIVAGPAAASKSVQLSAALSALPSVAWNHLAINEHIYPAHDGGYQLLAPTAERSLDSVSTNARIAVRYAYGIRADAGSPYSSSSFWGDGANEDAAVAVVCAASSRTVDATPYKAAPGAGEAHRRAVRDDERLLDEVTEVFKVITLPTFDDSAVEKSITAGVDAVRSDLSS